MFDNDFLKSNLVPQTTRVVHFKIL